MLIACPNCATSYQVDAYSIGVKGRTVRCARCKTAWFALPPGDTTYAAAQPAAVQQANSDNGELAAFRAELGAEPPARTSAPVEEPDDFAADAGPPREPDPEPPAAPERPSKPESGPQTDAPAAESSAPVPALSDIKIPTVEAPPLAPEQMPAGNEPIEPDPEDIERAAARRRERQAARRRKSSRRNAVPAVILILIMTIAALIAWRKEVVRFAPQMASLYAAIGLPVNLRGLAFHEVAIKNEIHDGVPVLTVEGKIVNEISIPVDVPRLRFGVRNGAGAEVYSWTAQPTQPTLEPGGVLPFRGRLASPPPDGIVVEVRFFTKRDAATAGR